jgi:outer membrane protein, multidrug efflux system
LEVLVGRYPSAELAVAERYAPLPPPVAPGLPSSLIERRPDIVAAEHQVFSAFQTHEAAKLALLPSFSFDLEGGRLSDRLLSVLGLNPWLLHRRTKPSPTSVVSLSTPLTKSKLP